MWGKNWREDDDGRDHHGSSGGGMKWWDPGFGWKAGPTDLPMNVDDERQSDVQGNAKVLAEHTETWSCAPPK